MGATELSEILRRYNEVTERLKRSHEALSDEVQRLREELQVKNRELERRERLAALGQMAAGVAHEIRNPLGGIRLYVSLLQRDLTGHPPSLELLRNLDSGVRNMESIVGDILAFAGDVEPRRRVVGLGEVVAGAREQLEPQLKEQGVLLEVSSSVHDFELNCDPRQVERALMNILLNACEATDRGGRITIRAAVAQGEDSPGHGAHCEVYVEDTGAGIDPNALDRLFNPFFTTKDTGTGLGLAIVHRIAEANGGAVRAANRPEGGAVIVLSLPLATGAPATNQT